MEQYQWEIIGWIGTFIFVASFLFKERKHLHIIGIIGSVVKLIYTYHHGLVPLTVNWLLVIFTHLYSLSMSRSSGKL